MLSTKYSLMMIEWEDSQRPSSPWEWLDEYELPTAVRCLSVGFIVRESDSAIALAPNLGDLDQPREQASGIICIPRCAIKQMIEIKMPA